MVAAPGSPANSVGEQPHKAVLVVDDEPMVRALVCRCLRQAGYSVVDAGDAVAALRLLEAGPPIGLVLTDIDMPGMDGREFARVAAQVHPRLPVLFMTGSRSAEAALATDFPGAPVMSKPFQLEDLVVTIRRAMEAPAPGADPSPGEGPRDELLGRPAGLERQGAELAEAEARFRVLADAAPVMIWISDPDGLRSFFNRRWLEFTGRPAERELGRGWTAGVHPDDVRGCLAAHMAALEFREPFRVEYRLRRHDGTYRWIAESGAPLQRPGGGFAGHVGAAADVTEQREAAEQRRALIESARLAVAGELAASLVHELNQPVTAMAANAHAALRELGRPRPDLELVRDALRAIAAGSRRARGVIHGVRRLVKRDTVGFGPVDLNRALREAAWLVSYEVKLRRVEFILALAPGPLEVRGDPVQLQQLAINLLLNAFDAVAANPMGERRVRLESGRGEPGTVRFAVWDAGPGIPPERQQAVFEPFVTTKPGGLGMGLAISRSIVEAHGGRIWVESEPTRLGCAFHVALPAAAPAGTGPG